MMYYYKIGIRFCKGGTFFIKEYKKSFLEIGKLFSYLENEHKDFYQLVYIKCIK